MAYYSRATVFLAMGKSRSALPDLGKVIELKPDFTSVSVKSDVEQSATLVTVKTHKQGLGKLPGYFFCCASLWYKIMHQCVFQCI